MDNGSWKWSDGLAVSGHRGQPRALKIRDMLSFLKTVCIFHMFVFLFFPNKPQLTYQNFARYHYNIRQCAAADLGSMTWLAMHCDSEMDWICKIPRGAKTLWSLSCVSSRKCLMIQV